MIKLTLTIYHRSNRIVVRLALATRYDSRGNKTTVTDPKLNVIVSVYDGASRLIETQQEMRQNGNGRNAPAANQTFLTAGGGVIRTEYVYDGNSRLIELVDDRGGSTVYAYDLLDRLVTKTLADGSVSTRTYDLSNCLTGYTDENVSVFVFTFDAVSRKITAAITLATGVGGTTAQSFQYDGLSRLTGPSKRGQVPFSWQEWRERLKTKDATARPKWEKRGKNGDGYK